MEERSTKPVLSQPKDETWQAYRDWVAAVYKALTGREHDETAHTEAWWKERAEKFWSKAKDEIE